MMVMSAVGIIEGGKREKQDEKIRATRNNNIGIGMIELRSNALS